MKKIKGFTVIELIIVVAVVAILFGIIRVSINNPHIGILETKTAEACGIFSTCPSNNESTKAAGIQDKLITAVPIPQLTNSLERENVSKRAQIFNTPDKISYIYLVSFGKVMAFYTVKGKVSSLQSYMVPTDKVVNYDGSVCSSWHVSGDCYVVEAPDIDGTYGNNVAGIFFFTTEGAYVEWKGDYMMSDQPLKLSTQPELVRQVK